MLKSHRCFSLTKLVIVAIYVVMCVAISASPGFAQDDGEGADDGGDNKQDSAGAWERLIYTPYRDLKKVFDDQDSSVIMPYVDYLKMLEKADGPRTKQGGSQVDGLITEASYVATVEKDLAKITAKLKIQVLGKPWVEIPVNFGQAAVGKMTASNKKTLLRGKGNGQYAILLSETGEHTVTLELVVRIRTSPDGRSLEFACPPVGITTFELSVPEPDQSVEVSPRLIAIPTDADDDETRVKASLGATAKIAAKWNPKASLKPQMDLLTSVTNHLQVTVDQGLVHEDAILQFEILRGELSELELAVPKGHRILDVTAAEAKVKGWKVTEEANRQLVKVELLAPANKRVVIEAHTEFPAGDEPFRVAGIDEDGTVHGIHALGAVRESGQVVVNHSTELNVSADKKTGLIRINNDEITPRLRKSSAIGYRFYSPKVDLTLSAKPIEPRILVATSSTVIFGDDELKLLADMAYNIERSGVFELQCKIPDGLKIDSCSQQYTEADGVLTMTLPQKTMGPFSVSIRGHRDIADTNGQQVLPLLEPVNADRDTGFVYVFAPSAIEVVTDESSLKGAIPDPGTKVGRHANVRMVSAWSYSGRPVSIAVKTERKPTRLTASNATTVNVKQDNVSVVSRIAYAIENAGIDTFRFSVPEGTKAQVRLLTKRPGTAIKSKQAADTAVDGQLIWTVVTQQEIVGQLVLEVSYDLKPDAAGDTEAFQLDAAPARVLDPTDEPEDAPNKVTLVRVVGEVAVEKAQPLSVAATATGDDIEAIDVRELTQLNQKNAYMAYRYYKQPVSLAVSSEKYAIQEVVETVVSRALAEVVLDRDVMANYLCRYRIKSSERQRLRVDLPIKAELLDPLVNGSRVALEAIENAEGLEEGWDAYRVIMTGRSLVDEDFVLTLQFRAPISTERPFKGWGGTQFIRLPMIGGTQQTGVVLQHLRTAIYVPRDYALVSTPDNLENESKSWLTSLWPLRVTTAFNPKTLDTWIGDTSSGIAEFPRDGHGYLYSSLGAREMVQLTWWNLPKWIWGVSGIVFLVGFVLRRTSWENKLTVALVAAFLLALYALIDREMAVHILAAAIYGMLAVAALWLISGLLGWTRGRNNAAPPDPFVELPTSTTTASASAPGIAGIAPVVPPPGVFEEVERMMKGGK